MEKFGFDVKASAILEWIDENGQKMVEFGKEHPIYTTEIDVDAFMKWLKSKEPI